MSSVRLAAFALAASFFGIAAYIGVSEQPARLALGESALLTQWQISLRAGFAIQGVTALIVATLAAISWRRDRDWRWLAGGALMLANWPWTLAVILPVNTALLALTPEAAGPETRAMIERWGELHAVRTFLGAAALAVFAWALARPKRQTAPS